MLKKYILLNNFLNFSPIWIKKKHPKKIKNYNYNKLLHNLKTYDIGINTSTNNNNLNENDLFYLKNDIEESLIISISNHIIYKITQRFSGENLLWITLSPKISNFQDAINKTKYTNLLNNIVQSISIKNTTKWKLLNQINKTCTQNLNELIKKNNIKTIILLTKDILKIININQKTDLKIINLIHPSLLIINPKMKNKIWERIYTYY